MVSICHKLAIDTLLKFREVVCTRLSFFHCKYVIMIPFYDPVFGLQYGYEYYLNMLCELDANEPEMTGDQKFSW